MQTITTVPNPILRQVSRPIDRLEPKIQDFIHQLGQTLVHKDDPPGVGISAIQVGMPLQIFLTLMPSDHRQDRSSWKPEQLRLTTYINPHITRHSRTVTLGNDPDKPHLEGCLSVPHLYGPVWRYQWIELDYLTPDSGRLKPQTAKFSGFPARVIQHEYDHIRGILFTDHILGRSPAQDFRLLGRADQLFFDQDDDFIPVKNPAQLINW